MAWVAVSRQEFRTGSFPAICAKTGARADGLVAVTAISNPGWTWILLLFGIFPFLIERAFARVKIRGSVPMSSAAMHREAVSYRVTLALTVLAIALIAAAVILGNAWAAGTGGSMLVAALLSAAVGTVVFSVGANVSADGEEVTLYRLNRDFASAVRGSRAPR